jgi:predicted RNase H-like nuclease (RuvC/YqgF family)
MLDKQSLVELADIYKEKYNRLIKDNAELERQIDEANAEIERLRKERDEARRELCAARRELCRDEAIIRLQRNRVHRDSEDVVGLAKKIAVERGWDCFKENTNE